MKVWEDGSYEGHRTKNSDCRCGTSDSSGTTCDTDGMMPGLQISGAVGAVVGSLQECMAECMCVGEGE